MLNKVKVNEVKEAPAIGKPEMMSGIRTKEAAESWARKNGYSAVYWFRKYERVYADKSEKQPASSGQQLVLSEQGNGCLEFMFLLAVVAFVLVVLLKDVPC